MKSSLLTLNDLLTKDEKLTFLVGAGCSVDAPSCLPVGRSMMEAIIRYSCIESEVEKILKLKELRFEQLVEIMRDQLDPELMIIDYYGQCEKPNLQHFFLAEVIKKGHFVITTNFDCLIEHALLQSGVSKEDIIVVVTKNDFERYSDPDQLFRQGKKVVYKIHGSTKNIITGEDTKKSLVATIQAFGSNKEGLNVFQVEPFKKPLFDNVSKDRSLIVMGYSGSDDFDVVPTLQVLKNLKNVVWINYVPNDGGKERVGEIDAITNETNKQDKINRILMDIKRVNNQERVFRVDANTTKVIERLLGRKLKTSSDRFSTSPTDWFKKNVTTPNELVKFLITLNIYENFEMIDDLLHFSFKMYVEVLKIAEQLGDQKNIVICLSSIGRIYTVQENYIEALNHYERALKIAKQLGDIKGKGIILSDLGEIYRSQKNYSKALKMNEEALKINEDLGDQKNIVVFLSRMSSIYKEQGNYTEALNLYERALKIAEQLGDLNGKATILNEIGQIYKVQGNYTEALKCYEGALKITEQLGDLKGKATVLRNMGEIYKSQKNYPEALKENEEALNIDEQLGKRSGKTFALESMLETYIAEKNYPEAARYTQKLLEIFPEFAHNFIERPRLEEITYKIFPQNFPRKKKEIEEEFSKDSIEKAKIILENNKSIINVIIGGEGGVGKTTLVLRYLFNKFFSETHQTKFMDFFLKETTIDNEEYALFIWDVVGHESARFLVDFFANDIWGAILVFDLTRPMSLENLEEWVNIIRKSDNTIPVLFIGTKLDLEHNIMVDDNYALQFKEKFQFFDYIKVSSKTGENVKELFNKLIEKVNQVNSSKEIDVNKIKKKFRLLEYLKMLTIKDFDRNELESYFGADYEKKNLTAWEDLRFIPVFRNKIKEFSNKFDKQLGDLSGKAKDLNNIGQVYQAKGNYADALKIDEQLGDLSGKTIHMNNIGNNYYAQRNYPEPLKLYKEALKIYEQLGDLKGKAIRLGNIAAIYYAQGNYPEALKMSEEALKIDEQLGDLKGKATVLSNIATIYYAQGNYSEAMKQYEEALEIYEQLGDLKGKATVLGNIGNNYYAQENYPEALKRYEEALEIYEQLGDLKGKVLCLDKIGMSFNLQGKYDNAIDYFSKGLELAKESENNSNIALMLNNIGKMYYNKGDLVKPLEFYQIAIKILEPDENRLKGRLLQNLGLLYKSKGDLIKAIQYCVDAREIYQKTNELKYLKEIKNILAELEKNQ